MPRIQIDNKYTVIHEHGTGLRAERHGEPWRDLTGDGLVLAMAQQIESLRDRLKEVVTGVEIIGAALTKANAGDPNDAPIHLQGEAAGAYMSGLAAAYQHALEMLPSIKTLKE